MQLYPVYPLFDIEIAKGRGCHVYDTAGTEYLDLYGGHAVISIGHAHPRYVEAVTTQVKTLGFYSNSVVNSLQEQLAERLGALSGYADYRLFLVNSGAEANENALKLASFHTGKKRVLAAGKAFHGRTSLAVEATDNPKICAPVNANGHVSFLPLNDLAAFEAELAKGDVAAVIVECIQGVGGIRLATADFLKGLRAACTKHGAVLVCDEIQCGYGRSGLFFAHQHAGIRPDLITCAKGIANGFPMGAVLISPMFEASYGQLGTTFGGNHLACAAALAVLDVFEDEKLVENAAETGRFLMAELAAFAERQNARAAADAALPAVVEIRGLGLMAGIEFDRAIKPLRTALVKEEHVFTGAASTNILRLLPPLTLTPALCRCFIEKLERVCGRAL